MAQAYKATAKQLPGRKSWSISFRHPLRTDNNNRPGRKVQKGLGAIPEAEATKITQDLDALLGNERFWSVGARAEAATLFDPRAIEIFYSDVESRSQVPQQLRDQLLPFPDRSKGYAHILLMGVPGGGKTTLVRQLIGTHPERDRFPSTSINRTTTFLTEVFMQPEKYEAAVTFLSEHETRFEVEECVSSAIIEAVNGSRKQVARAFLEKSDMRFRLKYVLGDVGEDSEDESDPYAEDELTNRDFGDAGLVTAEEKQNLSGSLSRYLSRIEALSREIHVSVERANGKLSDMSPEDRTAALDLIEEQAIESDEFALLVSEILDEIRAKFDVVSAGRFDRTTTGWPNAWYLGAPANERVSFLGAVRYFSGIAVKSWGKLLTPLVNGMRVAGPFKPDWAPQMPKLVLLDTEGLGHKANATADLPDSLVSMFDEIDAILFVDSAKNAMTNFSAGKALEGVVNAGHARKLVLAFTHIDAATDSNLKGRAKLDHIFGGVRNIVENQLAKAVSPDAARSLLAHLEGSTFYLGKLNSFEAVPARPELLKLLGYLSEARASEVTPVSFPTYKQDNLVFAIQEAARNFRRPWRAILGFESHPEVNARHWQTIKALSRRYAEGWDDGFVLRPSSNLLSSLASAISRFLESPYDWSGNPSPDQKREIIDRIKALISVKLPALSSRRLRNLPQSSWHDAYHLRGAGSTLDRRLKIEGIFERWVPIPDSRGDKEVQEFLDEVKKIVLEALGQVEEEAASGEVLEKPRKTVREIIAEKTGRHFP